MTLPPTDSAASSRRSTGPAVTLDQSRDIQAKVWAALDGTRGDGLAHADIAMPFAVQRHSGSQFVAATGAAPTTIGPA